MFTLFRKRPARNAVPTKRRELAPAPPPRARVVVVANRQPWSHDLDDSGRIVPHQPASGLVTGVEPLLRANGGTWIATSSGNGDREVCDRRGRISVPPGKGEYTLRRLWFAEGEYDRYYSGFANEALWPLCHTAHIRPAFRADDWAAYRSVNEAFARAAAEEVGTDGVVLVQDYHFALVPRMLREIAPYAATNLFWHIPWPNPEVFGICPWKEALLEGMLGSDVVGFHTRQHCLNFLESARRYLECCVDMDAMSVTFRGRVTAVRAYPISVEWPYPTASPFQARAVRASLGIADGVHIAVGVDRADYTKGLLERVSAVEQLLTDNPRLCGKFVLVQLACPTRTTIGAYRQLAIELEASVERVNAKFAKGSWRPVILQMRSFAPDEVRAYYAAADSALVTPLHDGMNLVAKEYVASRADGDGVLVLSTFAGAAKELDGALLVNPYDVQQTSEAILRAVCMPPAERRARMHVMREQVASHSIHHWSHELLDDLRRVRKRNERFWPHRPEIERPAQPAGRNVQTGGLVFAKEA